MRRSLLLLALASCAAKSASFGATPPPEPAAPGTLDGATLGRTNSKLTDPQRIADLRAVERPQPGGGPGSSKDDPLPTCGTAGSYVNVADTECADGSRPLDGDIPSGLRSRRGNVGPNAEGHIIDLYEVPCPEGPKQVYVDMYGCERARPSRSELEAHQFVEEVFLGGQFSRFIERCLAEEARGPDRVSLMIQRCIPAMPIALRESNKKADADAWLARYCAGTPPPTLAEPKRYHYFRNVLDALDVLRQQQRRSRTDRDAERRALVPELARICDIDLKAFEAWRKQDEG